MKSKKQKLKEMPQSELKIAIVTDPLLNYRDWHEQLKYILKVFPNSQLFTPYYNNDYVNENFAQYKIRDSFLQLIVPQSNQNERWLKLERIAYRMFSFKGFDGVLSISSRAARFAKSKGSKHISIVLRPKNLFSKKRLEAKDKEAMEQLDAVITNSNSDKRKIKRIYGVNSELIYPPISVNKFKPDQLLHRKENWFLTNSRVTTRALRLVIKAAVEADKPLKIMGPLREELDAEDLIREFKARGLVKFIGEVPEDVEIKLMQRCRAYIYPAKNNSFGKVVVEANAAGSPVIAYKRGAVIESVSTEYPKTGLFFNKYNYLSLAKVLKEFEDKDFDSKNCIMKAQEFDAAIFMYKLKNYVEDIIQGD